MARGAAARPPAERVRTRLAREVGASPARELPRGYQRLGNAVLVRLPASLDPWAEVIGRLFQEELNVRSVWSVATAQGELRRRPARLLAGSGGEVRHVEEGMVFYLDPSEILFAAGNRSERRRAGRLVRPGERVADLFAGIGYFTVPAAKFGRPSTVHAVEKDPTSFAYLERNLRANGVEDRVVGHLGDNRDVDLPGGAFDRVFLGLLPSSLSFVPRALELLDPAGGWIHVHAVTPAAGWEGLSRGELLRVLDQAGAELLEAHARPVKPYGPSRVHVVTDAKVRRR